MKKFMVLGATLTQVPLVKTAKELGYYTIVASIDGNYPAFEYADEKCVVDISKPEEVLKKAQELQIDGIATCCMDTPVRAVGYVCEHMNLCGICENTAIMCNDKYLMKECFEKNNVNTARYKRIENEADLEAAAETLVFPLVIKAVDLQASRGVYVVENLEEAKKRYAEILTMTRENYCIIEEFIKGTEFGAQAFVYNGEILFVLPHGDFNYCKVTSVPVGHYAPLDEEESIIEAAIEQATASIRALELNNCAINIDMIYKEGKVYMLELTGRAGATNLPELVSIYYGVDYYKMIAMMAMGEDPRTEFNKRSGKLTANASHFLLSEKSGVLKSVENKNTDNSDVAMCRIDVKPGDTINEFVDGKDRLGELIIKGDDIEICKKRIEEYRSNICFNM